MSWIILIELYGDVAPVYNDALISVVAGINLNSYCAIISFLSAVHFKQFIWREKEQIQQQQ